MLNKECIHDAVEKCCEGACQRGLLVLYFPDTSQKDAEDLSEEIEDILVGKLGIEVHVDN